MISESRSSAAFVLVATPSPGGVVTARVVVMSDGCTDSVSAGITTELVCAAKLLRLDRRLGSAPKVPTHKLMSAGERFDRRLTAIDHQLFGRAVRQLDAAAD